MKEIKILGAGLSGLTAAINLAKAGYPVTVYEKNKTVGFRFNGDIQGLENWSNKKDVVKQFQEMNLEINFDCDPFSWIYLYDREKTSRLITKTPLFYLIKRGPGKGTFDFGLKEQAQKLGVKIRFNKTMPPEKADINATGPIFKEVPGVDKGIVFDTKHPDTAVLAFDDEIAFEGYAYLLITKGKGCLCTVVMEDTKKVTECFENAKKYFTRKYSLDISRPKNAGGVGSFSLKHHFDVRHKRHDTLYVGESAGLQDFLWGFGMRYAIESGYLAAKSIIEGKDYQEMAEKAFDKRLKASIVNRYLWEYFDKRAYSLVVNHPKIARHCLYSVHNFNLVQMMLYPKAESYLKKKYPRLEL
jgi:flavin-dependent dehydrogenase